MLQSAEHYNCESYNAKLCKTLQNSATLLCAKGCLELQSLFFVYMKSFKPWKSFLHHRKLFELVIIAIAMLTIFILTENTDLFIEMKILLVIFCNYFLYKNVSIGICGNVMFYFGKNKSPKM